MPENSDPFKLKERLENVIPFTGATPDISNNNIIKYNNNSRPWKIFSTSIEHNNNDDISNIIKNDCSNNNFVLESKTSNIYFKAGPNKKIEFYSNTIFDNSANFNNIISERINSSNIDSSNLTVNNDLTVENKLIVNDISLNGKINIPDLGNIPPDVNTCHINGNLKVNGTITGTSTQQTGSQNIVESTINSSTIGLTTPSTAKFTDVSINNDLNVKNNISIENTLNVSNNILLKNFEVDENISELPQDTNIDVHVTVTSIFDTINLIYGGLTTSITNSNQKLYLSKGTYIFKSINDLSQNHLNFSCDPNFEDNFEISNNSTGTVITNNGKDYYGKGAVVNIEIKGYIGYIDIISYGYDITNNRINFEKIFLYKHNVNLLNKLDIIDNSINTLLELGYDASFTNVNILGELFVQDDVSFNKNVNISGELIVENDVSFNKNVNISGELIVENDVSFNKNVNICGELIVENDVIIKGDLSVNNSLDASNINLNQLNIIDNVNNNDLSIKFDNNSRVIFDICGIVTFNQKVDFIDGINIQAGASVSKNLIVHEDVSINGRLDISGDVSLNSNVDINGNLEVQGDVSLNSNVDICGNLEVQGDVSFNSNVDICGNLEVQGDVSLNSNVDICGNLEVQGDVSLNSNVDICGNLKVHYGIIVGANALNSNGLRSTPDENEHAIRFPISQQGRENGGQTNDLLIRRVATHSHNTLEIVANFVYITRANDYTQGNPGSDTPKLIVWRVVRYSEGSLSDDRLKHNEQPITGALNIIRKLDPQLYDQTREILDADYNGPLEEGTYRHTAGLIAQEVANIPELAFVVNIEEEDDNKLSVEYNPIFVYNIAATKELDAIVQSQQTEINDLKAENTLLKAENTLIKSKLNELLAEAGKSTI